MIPAWEPFPIPDSPAPLRAGRCALRLPGLCVFLLGLGAAAAQSAPGANPTLVFKQFSPGETMHMIAYGDMRFTNPAVTGVTNPRVRKWLVDRIAEEKPQVLLLTGDMPFTGADPADWQEFQAETEPWRANSILELPATGNHEIKGGAVAGIANYLKNFPILEDHRYYSALLGSVEVISLDCTGPGAISEPQARWFASQLDHLPRQVQYLFILYHMPWMADAQTRLLLSMPSKNSLVLRGILETRLNRLHAKVVVFNGHIHNYERFERRGVEYVVTGGGGAQPYPILIRGRSDLYRDTAFPVFNYVTLDLNSAGLHAVMWKVKDPDAPSLSVEQKDEFTIAAQQAKAEPPPRKSP
jgi:acid phosphatase type 7